MPQLRHAKSITVASDNVTWTAQLNQNIKFATGDPVTAADYVYSWGRGIELGGVATAAADWMVGTLGLKDPSQITAPSTYTLQFVLPKPVAPSTVMGLLATTPFVVINQKQTEANTASMTVSNSGGSSSTASDHGHAYLNTTSAGTGPYVMKNWTTNTNFTLQANPNYWGAAPNGPAHIPNVLITNVSDPATEVNGLSTGTYDLAWDVTPQQAQSLFWGPSTAVQESLQPRLYYIWLNAAQAPFNNPDVCNALKWAIDYNGIVNKVLNGFGQVWQTISFPNLPGADPTLMYSYNPTKAKQLLAQAGYPNGFKMTIYEANDQLTQGVVETVQSNLADVGVTATINNQPIGTTISEAQNHQIQSLIAGWGGGLASLANLIPAWTGGNVNGSIGDWFSWNDTMAQNLTTQWYAAPDDATANSVANQLTQYCLTHAPVVVFFAIEAAIAQSSRVGGFYIPNPEIFVDFSKVYKI
jgi:peptide/nickel transport system substrate-binding protein